MIQLLLLLRLALLLLTMIQDDTTLDSNRLHIVMGPEDTHIRTKRPLRGRSFQGSSRRVAYQVNYGINIFCALLTHLLLTFS